MTTDLIDLAERAIRSFGGNVSRHEAVKLLTSWRYFGDLSLAERAAVLARFPVRRTEPGSSGPGGW